MKKRIYVDHDKVAAIAKHCDCSLPMVSLALNYCRDSQLARTIRFVAMRDFGGIASWLAEPVCVNDAEKYEERWGENVRLVYDKQHGMTTLYVDGCAVGGGNSQDIVEFLRWRKKAKIRACV